MAKYAFLVPLTITLGAAANGTVSYQLSTTEKLTVLTIRQKSAGAFDVTNIRNSDGLSYTSGSGASPIDGDFFADIADNFNKMIEFPIPIELDSGKTLYFDLKDTSGSSNLVEILLGCIREVGPN